MAENEELSMIERMMKGEFDGAEITEEIPDDSEIDKEELDEDNTSGSDETTADDVQTDDDNNDDTDGSDDEHTNDTDDDDTDDQNDGDDQENDTDVGEGDSKDDQVNDPVEGDSDSDTKTKDQGDGADSDNDELNYKEEYAKLLEKSKVHKDYYEKATSEFMANGKKVKGSKDPAKVIQAQQALYGLEEKFSVLKKYKKYHAPLEKRGMITDQNKFDMAMNIMDGDKEAIKAHLKSLDIDPMELDLDNVNYSAATTVSSEMEMGLSDVINASENAGIRTEVEKVLYNDWDEDSVVDLLSTEGSRNMFLDHMRKDQNGESIFQKVTDKAKEMSIYGADSGFSELKDIEKYNAAMKELSKERSSENGGQQEQRGSVNQGISDKAIADAEAAAAKKIADAETAAVAKYKETLEKKNKVADDGRKKATSVSRPKNSKSTKSKASDPMKLQGDNFTDYWKSLERAGL